MPYILVFLLFLSVPGPLEAADGEDASQAEVYFLQGRWQKAQASYLKLIEKDPSYINQRRLAEAYFYSEELDLSLRRWKTIKEMFKDRDADVFIALINSLKNGDAGPLEELIAQDENNPLILKAMGIAHARGDSDETALYYFYKAVEKDPADYMSYFYIGTIYENRELFDEAIAEYKKAVAINPRYAQALNNLGYSYKEKKFYSYAIEMYGKAIKEMPENSGYHYNIGNAYAHKNEPEKAFESYKKAVELDPTFAKAHYNMGKSYERLDNLGEAIKEFELYIKYWSPELSPKDVPPPENVEKEIIALEGIIRDLEEEERIRTEKEKAKKELESRQ